MFLFCISIFIFGALYNITLFKILNNVRFNLNNEMNFVLLFKIDGI